MLPCSTYVLDHTLPVTPDGLFDIVQQFVENLPSGSSQPLGVYGDVHFTLTGVEWGADHRTIDVLAQLSVPRQEDHWRLHEADAYELVHAPTIRWDDLSSMTLVSIEVIPSAAEELPARIMARPGTAAEQLAIRLAAHIVRETAVTSYPSHADKVAAQEAAYEKWKRWLETRLEPLMSDKMDRKLGFSVGQSRVLFLNVGSDYFVTQLRELTDQVHVERFITEKGYISLRPTHLTYHPRLDRSFVLYLWGRHHKVEDGAETISHLGPVILLRVTPLTDKRIEVTATCVLSAVER
jgi:hypothetical protein